MTRAEQGTPTGKIVQADPVVTEIIRNAFMAAVEDMRATLWRSAYSPVIYEMKDCSVAIYDDQLRLLAQGPGNAFFLGALAEVIQVVVDKVGLASFQAGDAYILNDPYLTGSHLNDVDILSPVLHEGELVGFVITRAHWLDMGSKDAAYAVDSTEIYQEGLRLGPTKLVDQGQTVRDIVDILARNSRLPGSLVGDMNAQIAACRMGERRYLEIVDKFGLDTVRQGMESIFVTSATLERAAIAAIPDGVYGAQGYQDNDYQTDEPFLIKVTVTVDGERMIIDTTGSSAQRAGNTNCGRVQALSAARLAYKFLVCPEAGVTGGSFSTLDVIVESGSIFAAQEPAACLQYGTHGMLLADLIIKALAPAIPDDVAAGLPGDAWNVVMVGPDPRRPGIFVSAESIAGGWGANARWDGDSALIHFAAGDFKNLPVETMENKYPVIVRKYGLGVDSAGAGRHRGGLNIIKDYEITGPGVHLSLWFERTLTPQWGLFGGHDGAVPGVLLEPGTEQEQEILKSNMLPVPKGTHFRTSTGGGGGYGPPVERDPQEVRQDIIDGYESRQRAAEVYKVVFRGGSTEIDEKRTAAARSAAQT